MLSIRDEKLMNSVDEILKQVQPERLKQIETNVPILLDVLEKLLIRNKIYNYYEEKGINELFVAAAYLFDAFTEPNDIPSLFILRQKAIPIFNQFDVSTDIQRGVLQICESWEGEDSLLDYLIPKKGAPDDFFAQAVWICQTFLG